MEKKVEKTDKIKPIIAKTLKYKLTAVHKVLKTNKVKFANKIQKVVRIVDKKIKKAIVAA